MKQRRIDPQAFDYTEQQLDPVEYLTQEHVGVSYSLIAAALMHIS